MNITSNEFNALKNNMCFIASLSDIYWLFQLLNILVLNF